MPDKTDIMCLKEDYFELGYCRVPNLVKQEHLVSIRQSLCQLATHTAAKLGLPIETDSQDDKLHKLIPAIYSKDPASGGRLYDTMNRSLSLHRFFTEREFRKTVADLLNCDESLEMTLANHQFFINRKNDTRCLNGFHQDSAYYGDHMTKTHSLVAWFCLEDCSANDGALWVIPKSQKKGRLPHIKNKFGLHKDMPLDKMGLYYIDEGLFDKENAVQLETKSGDVLLMHFDLIHKSGVTLGDKVRYSCLARFSNPYGDFYE